MIRWGAPQYLVLLAVVPILALAMWSGAWLKARRLRQLADPILVPRLTDSRNPRLALVRAICLLLGILLLVLAVARPQWGEKLQVYKGRGIDIVVALDASKSMRATDVKPDRLTRAKSQIAALLDNLSTNRVGVVAFAGDAMVMCPLTPDVDAAKLFLDIIDPDNMPKPGTNIQRAVEVAASLFDPRSEGSRALLLVTDGDNLDGDMATTTRMAAEAGIRIFAVGVGTPEGSTIPEVQGQSGGTSYKKDDKDQIVVSRLAERLLLVMAKATDGRYFRSETVNLNEVVASLDRLQKRSIGGGEYMEYEERYQVFLFPAFLLIYLGLVMSDRRGAWFSLPTWRWRQAPARISAAAPTLVSGPAAGAKTVSVLLLVALSLAAASLVAPGMALADVGSLMRKGLSLERQGKYDEAIRAFQQAQVLEPDHIGIHYDLGRALYEKKQFAESVDQFQLGLLAKSKTLRARSLYNTGNGQFRQNRLQEAITFYSQSLLLRPDDLNAKQNLEYCWKMLEQAKQQPDSTGKQQPKNQPQQQPKPEEQKAQAQQAAAEKGAISKDQANRMLEALQRSEKEHLRNQPKKPPAKAPGGKDW